MDQEMRAHLINIVRDKIFYGMAEEGIPDYLKCNSVATEIVDAMSNWDVMTYEGAVYRVTEAEVVDTEHDRLTWHVTTER